MAAAERETRVAAPREAKIADAVGIYVGRGRRCADHEINEPFDVVWPLDENRQVVRAAHIGGRVAGMIDGGRDKAGIGKHLSDIVMADKGTAPAVREAT